MDKKIDALRDAVQDGNVETMTKILDNGVTVTADIGDHNNSSIFCETDTALVLASKHGHYECVKKLLEIGSSIYIEGEENYGNMFIAIDFIGALVNAASNGHLECVQLLAETRILNSCPGDGFYTDLMKDIRQHIDDAEYISDLFSRLGDDEIKSVLSGWKGHNLMSLLLLHNCDVRFLVEDYGVSANGWDYNGLTPLMIAILTKDLVSAKFLLTKGADVKLPEISSVEEFCSDGTFYRNFHGVEWTSGDGRIALMYAACMANPKMINLISEFTPAEVVNWSEACRGRTPVMYAASAGDVESVSTFISHGAHVNIFDFSGISTLDCAVSSENVECVEFLLKLMSPEYYPSAFTLSLYRNHPQLLSAIIKYYNETDFVDFLDQSYLMDSIVYDSLKSAQVLIENGHQVDYRNTTGITALMFACLNGKDEGVELLLKNGADVNVQTHEGITPLMFAACKGHIECLNLLMDRQADVDMVDHFSGTVFSAAIRHKGPCFDILLNSGKLFDTTEKKRLKCVHRESMNVFESRGNLPQLPVRNLISTMRHHVFDFEWTNSSSLTNVSFAAISYGISPSKFNHNDSTVSPLTLAFQECADWGAIKYLTANLYFFPEDYTYLIRQAAIILKDLISTDSNIIVPVSFYETISCQPLSLKAWSFLHVSKAITLSQHSSNSNVTRSKLVESLPIPDALKMKLSFKSCYSNVCMNYWDDIGSNNDAVEFHQLADLMFEKKSFWKNSTSFKKCLASEYTCDCEGLGRILDE